MPSHISFHSFQIPKNRQGAGAGIGKQQGPTVGSDDEVRFGPSLAYKHDQRGD